MFTGLIEDVGRIAAIAEEDRARRLTVETKLRELAIGDSLAVDGTCLTVVAIGSGRFDFVAAAETLERTTLGRLAAGDAVNLERPLRLGDRLGGHLVAGHVDGVGYVAARGERGEALDVTIEASAPLLRYVIEKGSIAVDGISLTVNRVDERGFAVSLIPHTRTATTLGNKPPGAPVNLEVDLIGKYVEKLVGPVAQAAASPTRGGAPSRSSEASGLPAGAGLTLAKLKEHGFAE